MNRNTKPIGIAFIAIGIALGVVFKNSAPGIGSGLVFIVLGIIFLIRGRRT